jgi:DNA repair protein RecN (Recombination protein N)
MIREIQVENLAIIERASVEFESGFTVLTGETGAGKSLLVDAIELALGERADSELVRHGAERARVTVVATLSDQGLREELGLEDEELVIERSVQVGGRSQARVNGRPVAAAVLRKLGQALVDLHGQHDHQALFDPLTHLSYLDLWIGEPIDAVQDRVSKAYESWRTVSLQLDAVRRGTKEREQRLDLLRFQVNELEAAGIQIGESEELEGQISRLRNASKLADAAQLALDLLGDGELNAADLSASAISGLDQVSHFDPELEGPLEQLREATILLREGSSALRAYAESVESDPDRLDLLEERFDLIRKLKRKYGETEAQILDHLISSRVELAILDSGGQSEEELEIEETQLAAQLDRVCQELTAERKSGAQRFAPLVEAALRELAMERACFQVSFGTKPFSEDGADIAEYLFSANAGEPPRPLSKIASGGEISRVMLAVKTALAGKAGVPTLIFDEVDAGLGGKAAAKVASKLEDLAQHAQIIVISHLPQIAGRAAAHFRIEKDELSGRARTTVRLLSNDERVEEIARMLAGDSVTDAARANARELLGYQSLTTSKALEPGSLG